MLIVRVVGARVVDQCLPSPSVARRLDQIACDRYASDVVWLTPRQIDLERADHSRLQVARNAGQIGMRGCSRHLRWLAQTRYRECEDTVVGTWWPAPAPNEHRSSMSETTSSPVARVIECGEGYRDLSRARCRQSKAWSGLLPARSVGRGQKGQRKKKEGQASSQRSLSRLCISGGGLRQDREKRHQPPEDAVVFAPATKPAWVFSCSDHWLGFWSGTDSTALGDPLAATSGGDILSPQLDAQIRRHTGQISTN